MFTIRKLAVSTLATLAGFAGVLLAVAPAAGLAQAPVNSEVTVLADSPWGAPAPAPGGDDSPWGSPAPAPGGDDSPWG